VRIAITGASGFLGRALSAHLQAAGHHVLPVRRTRQGEGPRWDPADGWIDAAAFEGLDAVVHLAGEPIGGRRWNESHKARVLDSRVRGTRLLAEALAKLEHKPSVLVSGSAIGYYGHRGDEILTEDSTPGQGFLAEVVVAWEASARPAADAGIRVVNSRTGLVLGRGGGILRPMLIPFRLGLGGRLGSGRQWFSWIALPDWVAAISFVIERDDLQGPVNVCAPEAVTNAELTATLGRVLRRPAVMQVPRFALEIALGAEMARETLLADQRVEPAKLLAAGFTFAYPRLEEALREMLQR
jgi:uncharacterized protein (TIGR01777 family)